MANLNEMFDLSDPMIGKINAKKQGIEADLRKIPGVIGVGVGMRQVGGIYNPEEVCLRVYVKQKKSSVTLAESQKIPKTVTADDGTEIPVDVVTVGNPTFYSFFGRYRPLKYGSVIGQKDVVEDGTFGLLVKDNTDGKEVMLSTNHTLANYNAAAIGSSILQPGPMHGGTDPADKIATLKRFATILDNDFDVNKVDAAIATPTPANGVTAATFCSYINVKKMCAVGMLMGGSAYITIINPISAVLGNLNCSYSKTAPAYIGQMIHKCGAATEYTTATITDVNASLDLTLPNGAFVTFENQILTAGGVSDAASGDSGAVWFTTIWC